LGQIRSSRLYERVHRHETVRQFIKYAMIGALNVVLFLALFNLFRFIGLSAVIAYVLAFVPTNINSFFLNKRWAFRDPREHAVFRQYLLFAFFTVVAVGINTAAFSLFLIPLRKYGTLGENIAALLPLPISVAWNFTSYKLWAFKKISPGPSEA
jgi:putative flippase GtrA